MTGNGQAPRVLAVGEEPPPLNSSPARRPAAAERGKAKGKAATRGRFQCINAFIDATMAGLTPAERSVWLILWRDTKPNGLAATSQADLARRAGTSDRAVRFALVALQRRGLVAVVRRGSLRRGPSSYRVFPLCRER
jgi:hypothetical protein